MTAHVLPLFWTPADGLRQREDRDRSPYCLWRDQGFLKAVPGRTIDYAYIAREIAELRSRMNLVSIAFDRWRIDDLMRELREVGVDCVIGKWAEQKETGGRVLDTPSEYTGSELVLIPHGQGFRDFNPVVELLEDKLTNGHLRHGMHPVLTMCASNVRVQQDPAGGRKFDKIKSTGRIDGIVALGMGLNAAGMAVGAPRPSVYESRGLMLF